MQLLYIIFSGIIVVASVLVTLVVLLQNSKGGGLAANFAAGNQTFGVRQTADFLEKLTWWLAGIIIVFCIAATFAIPSRGGAYQSRVKGQIEQTVPVEGQPEVPVTAIPEE